MANLSIVDPLPESIAQEFDILRGFAPKVVLDYAHNVVMLLHSGKRLINQRLLVSGASDTVFVECPDFRLLCAIMEENDTIVTVIIDQIEIETGRNIQIRPKSFYDCATIISRIISLK